MSQLPPRRADSLQCTPHARGPRGETQGDRRQGRWQQRRLCLQCNAELSANLPPALRASLWLLSGKLAQWSSAPSPSLLVSTLLLPTMDAPASMLRETHSRANCSLACSLKSCPRLVSLANSSSSSKTQCSFSFSVKPSLIQPHLLSRFSHARFFVTLWTVARQTSLSMGFSRQEGWTGFCHFFFHRVKANPSAQPFCI